MAYFGTKSADLESSSTQYFSIADASQVGLDITGDITIEFWMNPETLPTTAGANMRILEKKVTSGAGYLVNWDAAADKIRVSFNDSGGNNTSIECTEAISTTGTWLHVAVAVDVSVPSATWYFDGVAKTSNSLTSAATSIGTNSEAVNIGYGATAGNSPYDGKLALVRVWDTIRSESQIANNVCTLLGATANMQAEWSLNNVVTDNSGNGNTLTNNNATPFVTDVPSTCPAVAASNSNFLMFM